MKNHILISLLLFLISIENIQSAEWKEVYSLPTKNNFFTIFFTDSNTGYAVGQNGTIVKTSDGGTTWNLQYSNTLCNLMSVCFVNKDLGFCVGDSGLILKTTNGGDNWSRVKLTDTTCLNSVSITSNNVIYVAGVSGIILKSIDGGDSWQKQNSGIVKNLNSIYFSNDSIGYAVGSDTTILKTTNGGKNWNKIHTNLNWKSKFINVSFINLNTGYILLDYHSILITNDGGKNWISKKIDNFNSIYSVYFTNAANGYAVGGILLDPYLIIGPAIIYKTTDSCKTWVKETCNTQNALNSVFFVDSITGYACGKNGTIIKLSNISDTVHIIDTTYSNIIDKNSITIFPNPAKTTISITANNKQLFLNASVSITTINGKQVLQQTLNNDKTSIDVSTLSAGLYFVKVWNGSLCWVGRFLKE